MSYGYRLKGGFDLTRTGAWCSSWLFPPRFVPQLGCDASQLHVLGGPAARVALDGKGEARDTEPHQLALFLAAGRTGF